MYPYFFGEIMVFGWFKKKEEEPHFDPVDIKISDLRVGFLVDYQFKTYEVKDEFEYDWGDDHFTYEFKLISSDNDVLFLHIDNDEELILSVSKPVPVGKLTPDIKHYIMANDSAPSKLSLDDINYYQDSEDPGYYRNTKDETFDEFISWTFLDDSGKKFIEIEQWGEKEFEASVGEYVSEFDFSQILPGKE